MADVTTIRLPPEIKQGIQEVAAELGPGISFAAALKILIVEALRARGKTITPPPEH